MTSVEQKARVGSAVPELHPEPPSSYVDGADISPDDKPATVVRKLDYRFHEVVTLPAAAFSPQAKEEVFFEDTPTPRERAAFKAALLTTDNPAASHWHGLYRQAMQYKHDDAARFRAQILALEGELEGLRAQVEVLTDWRSAVHRANDRVGKAVPEGWDQIEQIATTRYKVTQSDSSMFHRHAVVASDGERQLYLGREVECEIMARKFAGAFLDGAHLCQQMLAAAPQPPVEVVSSDDLVLVPRGLLGSACAVMCRSEVPHTETLAELRRYTVGDKSAAPQPEKWGSNLLGEIVGCFDAAFTEGLREALAESKDTRLVDLVNRRLMHAYYAAIGPSKPEAKPTEARCGYCDGTGHVHDQIGEWRGLCTCDAGQALKAQPTEAAQPINLAIIRKWPEGFEARLDDVWNDVIGCIPNVRLYDLQRVLALFGFAMTVTEQKGGA